jgi:hypothetical protein
MTVNPTPQGAEIGMTSTSTPLINLRADYEERKARRLLGLPQPPDEDPVVRFYGEPETKSLLARLPAMIGPAPTYVEPAGGPAAVASFEQLPEFVELHAASRWFGISTWWLFGLVADRIVDAVRCEGRALVSVSGVARFLAAQEAV